MHQIAGFKAKIFKNVWGGVHRDPSPDPPTSLSRALLSVRASLLILGRFAPRFGLCPQFLPSIKASPSILGRNLGRFAPSVRALPSIYPLQNFDLVAPLGEGFGRKHGTDKWDWNGYYFHTGTCFFPIRALGIIMPTVVEPSTRLKPSIKLHAPIRAFVFSCFGTQCLTRRDEASDSLSPYRLHVTWRRET